MLGTALDSHSGIAAVVKVYIAEGLFSRARVLYLATHRDGGRGRKLATAVRAALSLLRLLLAGRVGLVHVLAASGASFWRKALLAMLARAFGVPYVMHIHCGRFVSFHRKRGALARRWIRRVLERARVVIALSEEWIAPLTAIAPGARIAVAPNPVQIPRIAAPVNAGRPTVLYLGMLHEAKGVHDLVRAWPSVLRAIPDARLVLAGSGGLGEVDELARALGIRAAVETPGWLAGPAKEAAIREAWVFALPSYAEALPMSLLECMAAGVPAVATRVGAIPSAIGDSGLLVPCGDPAALGEALLELLRNTEVRLSFGCAARERVAQRYSPQAVLPQIEAIWALYSTLAAEPPAAPEPAAPA